MQESAESGPLRVVEPRGWRRCRLRRPSARRGPLDEQQLKPCAARRARDLDVLVCVAAPESARRPCKLQASRGDEEKVHRRSAICHAKWRKRILPPCVALLKAMPARTARQDAADRVAGLARALSRVYGRAQSLHRYAVLHALRCGQELRYAMEDFAADCPVLREDIIRISVDFRNWAVNVSHARAICQWARNLRRKRRGARR